MRAASLCLPHSALFQTTAIVSFQPVSCEDLIRALRLAVRHLGLHGCCLIAAALHIACTKGLSAHPPAAAVFCANNTPCWHGSPKWTCMCRRPVSGQLAATVRMRVSPLWRRQAQRTGLGPPAALQTQGGPRGPAGGALLQALSTSGRLSAGPAG